MFYTEKVIHIENQPRVNVIIPSKNNLNYLLDCIDSFNIEVVYKNYKIIVADTGSDDDVKDELIEYVNDLDVDVDVISYSYYNFAKINNDVVKNYLDDDCELILFCNDDIYLKNDALSHLVKTYLENKEDVGTMGIRLHYDDKTIQHAGIKLKLINDSSLYISHVGLKTKNKYSGINIKSQGNTGAFLMINKDLFISVNSFNENYLECFEDVELNLQKHYQ